MPVKVTRMSATRVPARILRPGKEHAWLVVAGITIHPGISSRVPDMLCNIKEEVSRDIGKMMEILPSRGRDISNLSNSSTSKISSMSSTSKTSRRSSKT
jgi:hypothetical protein